MDKESKKQQPEALATFAELARAKSGTPDPTSPITSVLGAVRLTAYLGGAVATHARIGSPIFSHMLLGVYLGVILWGGLYLRDDRLRGPWVPPLGSMMGC